MLLYSYSYILDSKSNKQAFKKLLQQHIILAEPFDASQKYCLMHICRGIVFVERQAGWLKGGSVKLICSSAFCTQDKVSKKRSYMPVRTATRCFSDGTRTLKEQGERAHLARAGEKLARTERHNYSFVIMLIISTCGHHTSTGEVAGLWQNRHCYCHASQPLLETSPKNNFLDKLGLYQEGGRL